MSKSLNSYKEIAGRGLAAVGAWWEAGARARREHAIAVWGDGTISENNVAGADRTYRMIGSAWSARR